MMNSTNKDMECLKGNYVTTDLINRIFPRIRGFPPLTEMNRMECSVHIDKYIK